MSDGSQRIRLVLDAGDTPVNRPLLCDAWKMYTRELRLSKYSNCTVCGERATL